MHPDNVCDVIYQAQMQRTGKAILYLLRHKCQFSWFVMANQMNVDSATWMFSLATANRVMQGDFQDFIDGATHYHATRVTPY